MAAELREIDRHTFVVDLECALEEDWGEDTIGAGVRLDEHNELTHPEMAVETTPQR